MGFSRMEHRAFVRLLREMPTEAMARQYARSYVIRVLTRYASILKAQRDKLERFERYSRNTADGLIDDVDRQAAEIDDLRAQVARLTAERDGWHNRSEYWEISSRKAERERDQARKEVAAMEAVARNMPAAISCRACLDDAAEDLSDLVLDALKKARGG